jgi:hypothetical protein
MIRNPITIYVALHPLIHNHKKLPNNTFNGIIIQPQNFAPLPRLKPEVKRYPHGMVLNEMSFVYIFMEGGL